MKRPDRVLEVRDVSDPEERDRAVAAFLKRRLREKRAEGWTHPSDRPVEEYMGEEHED